MKPRIVWSGWQWMCHSPAIFGGRIVGCGKTPMEAYCEWAKSRGVARP
jgi:hypothetical protein